MAVTLIPEICGTAGGSTGGAVEVSNFPASQVVTATNLDVRDLTSAADSVASVQSGTWNVNAVQSGGWSVGLDAAALAALETINAAQSGSWTVALDAGSLAALETISVANFPSTYPVTDNAGSLTVDAPVGTPVFVRLSDGAAPIATLPISNAALAVGNNAALKMEGCTAHDGIDAGNPIKIGAKARTAGLPAAVAGNDRVDLMADVYGRLLIGKRDTFAINHAPAAAAQATISRTAAGAGVKNVCTSITVTLSSAAAPTVGVVVFNLRDGATGAGTILWTGKLSLPATSGAAASIAISDLWIEGTANTAMTLESAGSPPANVQATVSWTGTITQ